MLIHYSTHSWLSTMIGYQSYILPYQSESVRLTKEAIMDPIIGKGHLLSNVTFLHFAILQLKYTDSEGM